MQHATRDLLLLSSSGRSATFCTCDAPLKFTPTHGFHCLTHHIYYVRFGSTPAKNQSTHSNLEAGLSLSPTFHRSRVAVIQSFIQLPYLASRTRRTERTAIVVADNTTPSSSLSSSSIIYHRALGGATKNTDRPLRPPPAPPGSAQLRFAKHAPRYRINDSIPGMILYAIVSSQLRYAPCSYMKNSFRLF